MYLGVKSTKGTAAALFGTTLLKEESIPSLVLLSWSSSMSASCVVPFFLVKNSVYLSLLWEDVIITVASSATSAPSSIHIPDKSMRTLFGDTKTTITDRIVVLAFRYLEGIYGCKKRYAEALKWAKYVQELLFYKFTHTGAPKKMMQKICSYFMQDIDPHDRLHVLAFVAFMGMNGDPELLLNPAELFLSCSVMIDVVLNPLKTEGTYSEGISQHLQLMC